MSFVLGPSDSPVNSSKSDTVDGNFGGNRETTSNIQKNQDYKKPSGGSPNRVENPKDTVKDIDGIHEFDGSIVQESNEDDFITQIGGDNKPLEDTDPFEPDSDPPKKRRSKNKYHFGDGQYEGEIS
jgi:hypothetical protein